MGIGASSDFAGFNQIAASSNMAMIYENNVGFIEEYFLFSNVEIFRLKILVLIHYIIHNMKLFD